MAAVLLANVSGILVPRATSVMAVMLSSRPTKQPNPPARSAIDAVSKPMKTSDAKNVGHPLK